MHSVLFIVCRCPSTDWLRQVAEIRNQQFDQLWSVRWAVVTSIFTYQDGWFTNEKSVIPGTCSVSGISCEHCITVEYHFWFTQTQTIRRRGARCLSVKMAVYSRRCLTIEPPSNQAILLDSPGITQARQQVECQNPTLLRRHNFWQQRWRKWLPRGNVITALRYPRHTCSLQSP